MVNIVRKIISKKIRDLKWANVYAAAACKCNQKAFERYKGCNAGKKMVLCGAGPSLNQYRPIDGAIHVALNRALLNTEIPYDWMIADDWDGIRHMRREIMESSCIKFFGRHMGEPGMQIPETFIRKCSANVYYTDSFIAGNGYLSRFTVDIDMMPVGNMPNIALQAMQILLFTQPDVIYLAGCDASTGHFNENNISKEEIEKQNRSAELCVCADQTMGKWKELKRFQKTFYPDVKIVSVNPVGLKGLFKDRYMGSSTQREEVL